MVGEGVAKIGLTVSPRGMKGTIVFCLILEKAINGTLRWCFYRNSCK